MDKPMSEDDFNRLRMEADGAARSLIPILKQFQKYSDENGFPEADTETLKELTYCINKAKKAMNYIIDSAAEADSGK